jgi:acetyl-CoA C-acetyltransferase
VDEEQRMRDAVICEPMRTPVGAFGGAFRDLPAEHLATIVLEALLGRTGIDPDRIDDVVLGQAYANGDAPAIGRIVALDAGLPVSVPGLQVDRRCGSGLQAVIDAAMRIQTGAAELVIAGGAESMSQVEHYVLGARWGMRSTTELVCRLARGRTNAGGSRHPVPGGMIETAENLRAAYGISRASQDEFALASHGKALAAQDAGRFADELVPVPAPGPKGSVRRVDTDEHPRADTTLERLAGLRPIRLQEDPDATVTAGNSSGQNDGAALCVVTTPATAERLGLRPLARLVSWAVAGVEPARMGIGPVPASATALARAGLGLGDLDLIELNEAFAAQALAVLAEWGVSAEDERLNVNGSAISLGHPIGATGARILATGLRELDRRQGRHLLETMCIGGGQGLAAVFERTS